MRVVYLTKTGPLGPASRYRAYQYRERLHALGIDLLILPALSDAYLRAEGRKGLSRNVVRVREMGLGLVRRLTQLLPAMRADGVIIEREFFPWMPPVFEWLLARWGGGYLLELDDAIHLTRGRRYKYRSTARMSRAVIAGNSYLAAQMEALGARVQVVPTTIDLERAPVRQHWRLGTPPQIGWVGLPYNFSHLQALRPVLRQLEVEHGAQLLVVSARPPEIDLALRFVRWSENAEAEVIRGFDVGIMPLDDTPFARGKCGLKLLQYMAAAVPAVASPVGVNREIVQDGDNGLLAATPREWTAALSRLLGDEALRQRLGRAGRTTVEARFSAGEWAGQLAAIYRGVFAPGR